MKIMGQEPNNIASSKKENSENGKYNNWMNIFIIDNFVIQNIYMYIFKKYTFFSF